MMLKSSPSNASDDFDGHFSLMFHDFMPSRIGKPSQNRCCRFVQS